MRLKWYFVYVCTIINKKTTTSKLVFLFSALAGWTANSKPITQGIKYNEFVVINRLIFQSFDWFMKEILVIDALSVGANYYTLKKEIIDTAHNNAIDFF